MMSASESNSRPNGLSWPPKRATRPSSRSKTQARMISRRALRMAGPKAPGLVMSAPTMSVSARKPQKRFPAVNRFGSKYIFSSAAAPSPADRLLGSRSIGPSRSRGDHRLAAAHCIADPDADLCGEREVDVHPRAELDETDPVAAGDLVARRNPRDD